LLGTYILLTVLNSSFKAQAGSALLSPASNLRALSALAKLGDLDVASISLRKSCLRYLSVRGVEDD